MAFAENIEVTRLNNGIRVVSETVNHVQSVSLGLWVGAGAREEEPELLGVTHFIEHMLFKGTARRDARQLADEIESRGGSLNALTDREYTVYYCRSLSQHAELTMDVLTDMLRHSLLAPDEIAREKNVVLEEIKRYEDTPEDLVHDLFAKTLWPSHPLGRPIAGTAKTVTGLQQDDLRRYMVTHYTPDRVVVSAAGNIEHADIVRHADAMLGSMNGAPYGRKPRALRPSGRTKLKRKRSEQVQFCLGAQGYGQLDDRRYALSVLDAIVGGNVTSRLFQEIREKRGLAYSIGSYCVSYREGGYFVAYGGTSPETFDEVLDLTRSVFEQVRRDNVTPDELAKTKTQMCGSLVIGLESMNARMMRMGRGMLYHERVLPLNDIVAHINAVTLDDVAQVADDVLDPGHATLAAIGPFAAARQEG